MFLMDIPAAVPLMFLMDVPAAIPLMMTAWELLERGGGLYCADCRPTTYDFFKGAAIDVLSEEPLPFSESTQYESN